jgi:glycosyltransferase involved in cell wall biosynthesis
VLAKELNESDEQIKKMIYMESNLIFNSDLIFVRSEKDQDDLTFLSNINKEKILVGKSGIDDSILNNVYHLNKNKSFKKKIGFIGHLNYQPNIEAVHMIINDIAPRVKRFDPNIIFLIAGSGMEKFKTKNTSSNVKFLGRVSSLKKYFEDLDLALCPLIHGSGTRIKVLDYLCHGIPTITTDKGIEGLEIVIRESLIIENNISNYSDVIINIYKNQKFDLLIEYSKKGIEYIEKHRLWSKVILDYYTKMLKLCC